MVTVPAVVSAALGMYVAFITVLFGLKVPLPFVLQAAPEEIVNDPAIVTFALFAQTV